VLGLGWLRLGRWERHRGHCIEVLNVGDAESAVERRGVNLKDFEDSLRKMA